jgi:hypothetical protein
MRARLAAVLAVLVAFLAGSFVVRHPSSLLAYPDRVGVWLRVWEWGVLWRVLQCRLRGGVGVMPFQHEQWANLEPLGEELLHTVTHYTAPDEHISAKERPQAVRIRGRVESVSTVYFRWARTYRWRRRSDQPALGSSVLTISTWLGRRTYRPVIGSAVLEAREGPDFEPASDPDLGGLEGYIVELSPVSRRG